MPVTVSKEGVLDLYGMLSYARPYDSEGEKEFTKNYLLPLELSEDKFGNLYKRIGTSPVAWSCHTDTVHHSSGRQYIQRDDKYIITLKKGSKSSCLGADDTAGVWLMSEMVKAKVPGLYIFHRGEEVGCKGSAWVVANNKDAVKDIKFMIALDRRDNNSVITFQRGFRCCSDAFGESLATGINLTGAKPKYELDKTGVYTDSAQYVDIIGECTNLSVGYKYQHGKSEELDMMHLVWLRERLIGLDQSKLVESRKAGEKESRWGVSSWSNGGRGWHDDYMDHDEFGRVISLGHPQYYITRFRGGAWIDNKWKGMTYSEWEKWKTNECLKRAGGNVKSVLNVVRSNPAAVAQLLESWGFDPDYLLETLEDIVQDNNNEKRS